MAACPLCGAVEIALALNGHAAGVDVRLFGSSRSSTSHGQILRCEQCEFTFSRDRPSEDQLLRVYRAMDTSRYQAEEEGRAKTAKRHMRFLARMMPPGRLLDVGCASGAFLRYAIQAGWSVAGVEPSSRLAEAAIRATGGCAEIQCCSLQDARFDPCSFDAITLFDVLEHVPDPISFIGQCRRLLKADGALFVNVPDIGSYIARLLGTRWPLLLPEHLNYFNRNSLERCARVAGFRIARFSSRTASFSVGYVLHRLTQHDIPGARLAVRWLERAPLSRMVVSIPLGESLTAWRPASRERGQDITY